MPPPAPPPHPQHWRWGAPGDLPPQQPYQPYHPPLLRRAAAAAALAAQPAPPRMRRRLLRHRPRTNDWQEWEYFRGMPAMFDERVDWEVPYDRDRGGGSARRRLRGRRFSDFLGVFSIRFRRNIRDRDDIGLSYEELLQLDEGVERRGLTADELKMLMVIKADKEHMRQCCHICLEGIEYGNELVLLICSHYFHRDCIVTWLRQKRNCPICRCDL